MKSIKYFLTGLIALPMLMMSCGGATTNDSDTDTSTVADSAAISDSTKSANDSTAAKPAPERVFNNADEAMTFMRNSGHWNEYQNGIIPRMTEEALSYAGKLLNNSHKYFIVVDKAVMKVILYDKYGQKVKEYGCAASKNFGNKKRKGDSRTPEGFFTAEGVYDSTDWLFTNDAGYTSPARGQFGPRFIRFKEATAIGIHGTAAPRSIGRRVSHGCIRLTNDNILDLVKYAEAGMPIIVSPGPQDMRVNKNEGTPTLAITTGATKTEPAPEPVKEKEKSDNKKQATKDTKTTTNKAEDNAKTEPATEKVEEKPAEKPAETPSAPVVQPSVPE